jgi:AraC-like DNA-binding protein
MGRTARFFEGRFGRLALMELAPQEQIGALEDPAVVLQQGDGDVLFLNPGEIHIALDASRVLVLHAAADWLRESFPALFAAGDPRPFPQPREPVTRRIRQLADTLAIEATNDQFLSAERLEFMLQELMLSVVEGYLARRRSAASLWRGSRFADTRIRKALGLLRARPNKDVNIDELASQVGLSRSRFYDLFQICTGRSPRAYLDMLCVESAIAKLSRGRARIADVSAELGFSAQSNFTRFFLNQVGIPPSEYRRAATRPAGEEPRATEPPA